MTKAKIVVSPNVEMNIDVTADNLTDIYVAAVEKELERQEAELTKELKEDQERHEEAKEALDAGIKKFGDDLTDDMERDLIPVMRRFGFKTVRTTFAGIFVTEDKVRVNIGLAPEDRHPPNSEISGHIQLTRVVPPTPELKKLWKSMDETNQKVQTTSERLLKVKENLSNPGKFEREARANMAKQLLSTTDAGRQLLDMLRSRKALPMKE